jgi:hypothetical protein
MLLETSVIVQSIVVDLLDNIFHFQITVKLELIDVLLKQLFNC